MRADHPAGIVDLELTSRELSMRSGQEKRKLSQAVTAVGHVACIFSDFAAALLRRDSVGGEDHRYGNGYL